MTTFFRTTLPKRHPAGRVCETENCTTVLSVYNSDDVCHACYEKIPLTKLPTTVGRYL